MRGMCAWGAVLGLVLPFAVSAQGDVPLLGTILPEGTVRTFDVVNQGVNAWFDFQNGTVRTFLDRGYLDGTRSAVDRYRIQGVNAVRDLDRLSAAAPDLPSSRLWNGFKARISALADAVLALPREVWADAAALWDRLGGGL